MNTILEDRLEELHDNEAKKFKYVCSICGKPNNYWIYYCEEHEAQCDREMDEATS